MKGTRTAKPLLVPGAGRRYTAEDARDAGHVIDVMEIGDGRMLADCSCGRWGSALYHHRPDLERAHVEHAAEAEGKCWGCSQPDDGSNRDRCYRCWVMWWSRERGTVPRDIPEPWPVERKGA